MSATAALAAVAVKMSPPPPHPLSIKCIFVCEFV
ncbi:unnamed protein product [Coregonus sp. 'balchen']|nr:unnamed protein product [Coregonus sp. 'balchen']